MGKKIGGAYRGACRKEIWLGPHRICGRLTETRGALFRRKKVTPYPMEAHPIFCDHQELKVLETKGFRI